MHVCEEHGQRRERRGGRRNDEEAEETEHDKRKCVVQTDEQVLSNGRTSDACTKERTDEEKDSEEVARGQPW